MNSNSPVYVLGAGGHAKVVLSALERLGHPVHAIFDDDPACYGQTLAGVPIVGPLDAVLLHAPLPVVIAIGDNRRRRAIAQNLNVPWQKVIDRDAIVDRSARIGNGTMIVRGAIVQPDVVVGEHVIINTAATLDHDCTVADFVHLAPGVRLAGGVTVGEGTMMGIGSVAIPRVRIGCGTIVGAGAVVIGDLPDNVLALGVPARVIRRLDRSEMRQSA